MNYLQPPFLEKRIKPQNPFPKVICEEIGFIDEALGSFKGQPEIAEQIADTIVRMWENGETTSQQDITLNGEIIPLVLKIKRTDNLMSSTHAEIGALGDKNERGTTFRGLEIEVTLSQFDAFSLRGEELKDKLLPIIAHELMHGNMFSLRLGRGKDIDVAPWYEAVLKILEKESTDIVREFAYSMYACYYYERQAIISSTYTQLLEKFSKTRREFIGRKAETMEHSSAYDYLLKLYKKELVETEAYQTFTMIDRLCSSISPEDLSLVEDVFKKYGCDITGREETRKMTTIAKEALKDVARNGSAFFHDVLLSLLK